jgi:hypothetical protein
MEIGWLMPLVGAFEVVGGVLFMITKTRALGAIVILPIMVGIMLTHILDAPRTSYGCRAFCNKPVGDF